MNRSPLAKRGLLQSASPGIALGMAAMLLGYAVWRQVAGVIDGEGIELRNQPAVIIELRGAVDNPGFYFFSAPPAAADVLAAAGQEAGSIAAALGKDRGVESIPTGAAVVVTSGEQDGVVVSLAAMDSAAKRAFGLRVDLNAATAEDLMALPGVGPETARAIISARMQRGRYVSVEELEQVKGIGSKRVRKLARFLAVEPGSDK